MNTQEKARELLAQDRHHDQEIHEKMLNRTAEEDQTEQQELGEKARELLVKERLEQQDLDEKMLNRAVEEIDS